jgi:hypothetical protein
LLTTSKGEEMTLKSKWMSGLLALAVVLALAPASFAQVSISIATDPSSGEIQTNHHAMVAKPNPGDGVTIIGTLQNPSSLSTTTLTLQFPVPITNNTTVPAADAIRIVGASGLFANVSNPTVSTSLGTVSITLPACGVSPPLSVATCGAGTGTNAQGGTMVLVGVRIDANAQAAGATLSVSASLNNGANGYFMGTSSATIISALAPGIAANGLAIGALSGGTSQGTASIFTNRSIVKPGGSFIITEGCASCWRTATQSSNSTAPTANGSNIRLTFNNIPTGVTMTLTAKQASTGGTASTFTPTVTPGTLTATSNTATISFNSTSTSSTEQVEVDLTVSNVTTTATLSAASITVTATMAPIGDAFDGGATGFPTESGGFPRFADLEVGPITVVSIVPANTVLLIPYALVAGAIDTGIEIANTTADPFGGAAAGGAVPTNGTIRFDFFPSTSTGAGTTFGFTTSATNRLNTLDANGNLVAGSILAANTSQLLPFAGVTTGGFQGYIFITANFLNAHGIAFMSDYKTFFLSEPVMVLSPPATASRNTPKHENVGAGAEVLLF